MSNYSLAFPPVIGVGAWEFVFACVGFVLILAAGLSMIYWYTVEDYLLKKGWIPWLNRRHERQKEKQDKFLKEFNEREKLLKEYNERKKERGE